VQRSIVRNATASVFEAVKRPQRVYRALDQRLTKKFKGNSNG
jgi:hypothetical protein